MDLLRKQTLTEMVSHRITVHFGAKTNSTRRHPRNYRLGAKINSTRRRPRHHQEQRTQPLQRPLSGKAEKSLAHKPNPKTKPQSDSWVTYQKLESVAIAIQKRRFFDLQPLLPSST